MRAYRIIRASTNEPRAVAGSIVYETLLPDFGLAAEDTSMTGVPHLSVTLDNDGMGPSFSIPAADVVEVETQARERDPAALLASLATVLGPRPALVRPRAA